MEFQIAFGKGNLHGCLPEGVQAECIYPKHIPGCKNPADRIRQALEVPIGKEALSRYLKRGMKVGVIVSDITRYVPYHHLLPPLLEVLNTAGTAVNFYVATGTHRKNTKEELASILGNKIADAYPILQNDCTARDEHAHIGTTSRGNRVFIHRDLLSCDIKILTGFIEPHFFAGFSGGGKAVMPGMAGLSTIQQNHGTSFLDDTNSRWGITEGNPVWEDIHEASEMIPGLFLINVTLNTDKEITGVWAGDVHAAHRAGVEASRKESMVPVRQLYDLVITGNGGYPFDLNLYQAVKGLSAASGITKKGGEIIMAADCWDGIPSHGDFGNLLRQTATPEQLLLFLRKAGVSQQDMWQVQIHAEICRNFSVRFYTKNLTSEEIKNAFMAPVYDFNREISDAVSRIRRDTGGCRVAILPHGPLVVPYHP